MKLSGKMRGGLLAALAVLMVAGCNDDHADKIRDIADNSAKYNNKDVTVAGEVTKVYELPLGITNLAAYRVNDGTGQIWVISHAGAPREGDKIGLKGTVRPEGNTETSILGSVFTVIDEKQRKME